jgi:hypothetical protein
MYNIFVSYVEYIQYECCYSFPVLKSAITFKRILINEAKTNKHFLRISKIKKDCNYKE